MLASVAAYTLQSCKSPTRPSYVANPVQATQGVVSREGALKPRHPAIERCVSRHVSQEWGDGETYRDYLVAINFKTSPVWVDVVSQQDSEHVPIESCLGLKLLNSEIAWRDGMLVTGFRYYPAGPPTTIPPVQGPITVGEVQQARARRESDPDVENCMVNYIGSRFYGALLTRFVVVDGEILEATVQMSTWKDEGFLRCANAKALLIPFPNKKGTSTIQLVETARSL